MPALNQDHLVSFCFEAHFSSTDFSSLLKHAEKKFVYCVNNFEI